MVLARLQPIAPDLALPLDEVVFLDDPGTAPGKERGQDKNPSSRPRPR